MKNFIKEKIKNFLSINKILENQNEIKKILGKIGLNNLRDKNLHKINDYEFKVFSQFGEDGIINFLINNLDIKSKKFIEFGVENYEEANSRFLLENNSWEGLIIDSSKDNINFITKQNYYWKYNLTAKCEFITKENINDIIYKNNFSGKIGLLSIDLDGNDYWIWECINTVDPDIVLIEFNARLGIDRSITVPYSPSFDRKINHFSNIIYGASLLALNNLAKKKNYSLICTNRNANNAFFIKKELLENVKSELIKSRNPSECNYIPSFNETLDENGNLTKLTEIEIKKIIEKFNFESV